MGNIISDISDPNQRSLKSFKDIKFDINNINEIFSNDEFIYEFGCHLTVNLKSSPKRVFAALQYKVNREVDFEVEMRKTNKLEVFNMNLIEFYKLYESVMNYSIVKLHSDRNKQPAMHFSGEKKLSSSEGAASRFSNKEDENLCVICFEKAIEVVLPCSHGFCDGCCTMWYVKKNKRECPMCRKSIEGNWQEKVFEVVSNNAQESSVRKEIVNFVNNKAMFLRIR